MIRFTRRQARQLRASFRRHALGLPARGPVPPLVFVADPEAGLRVRHHAANLAVESILPGRFPSTESIALPLETLADIEGQDDSMVTLESAGSGRVVVRWDEHGVPRSREDQAPDPATLSPFPVPPLRWSTCPAKLLEALIEAGKSTGEDSPRYALGCIQMRGGVGEIVATDGHEIFVQAGFSWPWNDDVVIRSLPPLASRDLPRDRPLEIGRTDTHVVFRASAFTLWLTIPSNVRYPRIDDVIRDAEAGSNRLHLDPRDAEFLAGAIEALPGHDADHAPVTLDLNGIVAVRARPDGEGPATELILARSRYDGAPIRLATDRSYLARAVGLGLRELRISKPEGPILGRADGRTYAWQPLGVDAVAPPSEDAIRVESDARTSEARAVEPSRRAARNPPMATESKPRRLPAAVPPIAAAEVPSPAPASGLAGVIREAEALHEILTDARGRSGRLVTSLRKHRKQSRLVQDTLKSLRELRLQGVGD